ncbi:hypothetical protein L0222_13510, partial [bacterium]|nr:hypothetical protein [bacterium]
LLLIFRLFKSGDIAFPDFIIERPGNGSFNAYSKHFNKSLFKYQFEENEITDFSKFWAEVTKKPGFRSKYFDFALEYFDRGTDKGFGFDPFDEKIVNYVIALEALFLIDNKRYWLRGTMAERVSRLLKDPSAGKCIREMYDERSNIVHGNNLDLSVQERIIRGQTIEQQIPDLDSIIRRIFLALFVYDFHSKQSIVEFMEKLYDPPEEAFEIMNRAKNSADRLVQEAKKQQKETS